MKETNDLSTKCNVWTQLNFRILIQSNKQSRESKFILGIILSFSWWHNSITVVIENVFLFNDTYHEIFPLEKGMATDSSILAWRIPWRDKL